MLSGIAKKSLIGTAERMFLLGGLALSGYMSATAAVGLLVAFPLLAGESYLATYTLGTFRLSHGRLSPTEPRRLPTIGNVALFTRTEATIRNTTALYGQERLP